MNAPTNTSVSYKQIDLSWNAITNSDTIGRDTIIYWSLEWFNRLCYSNAALTCGYDYTAADGTWTEITTYYSNGCCGGGCSGGSKRCPTSTSFSH